MSLGPFNSSISPSIHFMNIHSPFRTLTWRLWSSILREIAKEIGGPDGLLPLCRACLRAHYSLQIKQNRPKKTLHWNWIGLEICPSNWLTVESGRQTQPIGFGPFRFPCRLPSCSSPTAFLTGSICWDDPPCPVPAVSEPPAPLHIKVFWWEQAFGLFLS